MKLITKFWSQKLDMSCGTEDCIYCIKEAFTDIPIFFLFFSSFVLGAIPIPMDVKCFCSESASLWVVILTRVRLPTLGSSQVPRKRDHTGSCCCKVLLLNIFTFLTFVFLYFFLLVDDYYLSKHAIWTIDTLYKDLR